MVSFIIALCTFLLALPLRAMDQAKPGTAGKTANPHASMAAPDDISDEALAAAFARQDRTAFEQNIKLDDLRLLATQNLDQIKIMDSWARQSLRAITHHESLDGKDSLTLALDMAFRPEAWVDKNIIYVESVPIRDELGTFAADAKETKRIHDTGMVSYLFLHRPDVSGRLDDLGLDTRQLKAVNKVKMARDTFQLLFDSLTFMPPAADQRTSPWFHPGEVAFALTSAATAHAAASGPAASAPAAMAAPASVPWHYTADQQLRISLAFQKLDTGWRGNDVAIANAGIAEFLAIAPTIDPQGYPSAARRTVELWYNRSFSGTLVAFIYFVAVVLFFLTAIGITKHLGRTYKIALSIYSFALACHVAAMAIRWWIDGRIPIQNQFESVLGSACIGCIVGLCLELWKKNGIFGAAFAFVGFIAATALLASPYVFGTNLGADPAKVSGILSNTFWLYIHVNIVISSYSLIFASAVISLIYLGLRQWHWINPIEPGFDDPAAPDGNPGLSPAARNNGPHAASAALSKEAAQITAQRTSLLDTLDQANMVVLQMAFWSLGVGIMCGAVWADQSWGRPWGWDPKETFALVTWIVYLIIVHVRLVIKGKADTTAVLSLAGCGVMLFNWIGVNFWLVGLHSYA